MERKKRKKKYWFKTCNNLVIIFFISLYSLSLWNQIHAYAIGIIAKKNRHP